MKIDRYGLISYNSSDLINFLYQGKDINSLPVDDIDIEIKKYLDIQKDLDLPNLIVYRQPDIDVDEFDKILQSNWYMPDEYKKMDIEGFLVDQCPKQNYQRLIDELEVFRSKKMLDLLRWLKYFVDTCRKNNLVWGVGRGSSVSSYVLFLLGVHKIDSVKYNLDWREFLR